MTAYHVEIRAGSETGRTLCQVDLEARKVGDIDCVRSADTVGILLNGETTAVGYPTEDEAKAEGGYVSLRWPLDKLTEDPVVKKL